ncbi:MAG: hypothetical protein Q8P95_02470 [bacterium]|nr:hypothetical protein [bacterium]
MGYSPAEGGPDWGGSAVPHDPSFGDPRRLTSLWARRYGIGSDPGGSTTPSGSDHRDTVKISAKRLAEIRARVDGFDRVRVPMELVYDRRRRMAEALGTKANIPDAVDHVSDLVRDAYAKGYGKGFDKGFEQGNIKGYDNGYDDVHYVNGKRSEMCPRVSSLSISYPKLSGITVQQAFKLGLEMGMQIGYSVGYKDGYYEGSRTNEADSGVDSD